MVKVIYRDLERAAPYVKFYDYEFTTGAATEVKDDDVEALAAMCNNKFFVVEALQRRERARKPEKAHASPEAAEPSPAFAAPDVPDEISSDPELARIFRKGVQAFHEGNDRRVPPKWAAQSETWLMGYDNASIHGLQEQ